MVRKIVLFALLGIVGLAALVLLAPFAPDGSWVRDTGGKLSDGLAAWWGYPIVGP